MPQAPAAPRASPVRVAAMVGAGAVLAALAAFLILRWMSG
jgi:hypothetical protein